MQPIKHEEAVREKLAELEHDQWIAWSKNIAETENITPARLERWKALWCPYSELSEPVKDQDREWADKVLEIVKAELSLAKEETRAEVREWAKSLKATPVGEMEEGHEYALDQLLYFLKANKK